MRFLLLFAMFLASGAPLGSARAVPGDPEDAPGHPGSIYTVFGVISVPHLAPFWGLSGSVFVSFSLPIFYYFFIDFLMPFCLQNGTLLGRFLVDFETKNL